MTTIHTTFEDVLPALVDPERLAAMQDTGLLSGGDETLDRISRLASALVRAPRAFVTMVTPEGQHLPGLSREEEGEARSRTRRDPLDASLCQFTVATGETLVIPDSHLDPLVQNMAPVRNGEIGAYAGVPLRAGGGSVLGTLCVIDPRPRQWAADELTLLDDLAALAAREVEGRLTTTRENRVQELSMEVVRQVPPLADAIDSLFHIAEGTDNARLQRYAGLAHDRVAALRATADRFQTTTRQRSALPTGPSRADLRDAVSRAVRSARAATRSDLIQFVPGARPLPVECDGVPLERAITHLLVTALHHSDGGAPVVARLGEPDGGTADAGRHAAPEPTCILTVTAIDCRVPAGELARVVSRFHEASCGPDTGNDPSAGASLRVAGGSVTAETPRVRGRSSRDGLVLTVRWPLIPA